MKKSFYLRHTPGCIAIIIWLLAIGTMVVGEVKCIVKAVQCNWEPIGKAEIIYGVGAFTPIGPIIGYFNIEDK